MSQQKRTNGPWRVEEGTTLVWGACDQFDTTDRGMGYPIAEAKVTPSGIWANGPDWPEGEANARLIAAAPDLLEALKELVDYNGGAASALEDEYVMERVSSAIAKAEGQS